MSLTITYISLERSFPIARFIKRFSPVPGFLVMVNATLHVWFMFMPFVLAEISDWFIILLGAIRGL